MNTWLKGWNVMRMLRLALGIFVIAQGVHANEWALVVMGGLFSLMPLFNVGCCATGSCATPPPRTRRGKMEDIHYEEVK